MENFQRFAGEIYPYPMRGEPFRIPVLWQWFADIWTEKKGWEATQTTFSISVVAIILAGAASLVFLLPASRNVASPEPFLPAGSQPGVRRRWTWHVLVTVVRSGFIVARAIPEYIWAFLLIAMLGPGAWPAILALAIHNFGILGKLGAEVVENLDPATPRALRGQGLSRAQIGLVAVFPMSLPKWLLFFFYRWETCIREATVLGMLGIMSLGYLVQDARVRDTYDEMLLFILLGAMLVLIGDLVSAMTRRWVRLA
jgi:phosphonate transport system permease protein